MLDLSVVDLMPKKICGEGVLGWTQAATSSRFNGTTLWLKRRMHLKR